MARLWRWVRRLLVVAIVLVLVLLVAFGGLFTWLVARGMPQRAGTAHVPGLSAPVRVVRDQNGIVNIYASTTQDLFAAQGYIHASERMWQMEVWRRIGAGRLSELFGDTSIDDDIYIRTLGWRHAAEADLAVLSDQGRTALESYASGVNAWLDQHTDMPLPFVIAGFQGAGGGLAGFHPEHWTPLDTLTWQKVQAWSLGGNYGEELLRALLLARGLSEEQIAELAPAYDPARPTVVPGPATALHQPPAATPTTDLALSPRTAAGLLRADNSLRATVAMAGAGAGLAGSNGFVVAPSRSATGGALLANDPHLEISMPSVWFLVGLHCDQVGPGCPYDVAGAGFPGVPGIVLGHNARIAWGLTNVGPDTQDVFEETLDPADPTHYLYKGESRAFDVRHETINVAGADPVTIDVRSTIHGPVVSDVDSDLASTDDGGAGIARDGYVYALAWAATAQPDRTLESLLGVNRAGNWDEFRHALRDFGAPSQTFLYADVDGNIGVQVPGLMPVRAAGDGLFPVSGADGAHDWTGFVPFDELPSAYNPIRSHGLIVAANNLPSKSGPYLGRDFDPGYRSARIHALLDGEDQITTDDLRAAQADVMLTRSEPVTAVLATLAAPSDADAQLLRQRILDWAPDPTCTIGSLGCAAYETFEYRLQRGVLDDELGAGYTPDNGAWRYVGTEPSHEFLARLVGQAESAWWDDTTTSGATETRDQVIAAALAAAAADLRSTLGDPQNWTWGRIHTVTFEEQTLGTAGIAPLEWIFNKGPFAAPGSCTTVNKICGSISTDWPAVGDKPDLQLRFTAGSSPSYRLVVDMADLDGASILQTTGQSGLPFDAHYGDFIVRWLQNSPLPLPFSSDAVDGVRHELLTLEP